MKQKTLQLLRHPLIHGSTIIFIGTNFANVFNFLFTVFMIRILSIENYGVLASIISIISYPTLLAAAMSPLIVKFAGEYFAGNDLSMVRGLYSKIGKLFFFLALVIFIIFLIFIPQIDTFFRINNRLVLIITDIIIFITIIGVINIALLQAKLAFGYMASINFISTFLKLTVGIGLVLLGFSVNGAVTAFLLSVTTPFLLSFIPLRFLFHKKLGNPPIPTKELLEYGLPTVLTSIGLTSFISSDILLVKHFYSPHQAGIYAGLSLIGKVIFYFSAPISTVMFPLIVQKYSKKENYTNTFKLAMALVLIASIPITTFYFLYPQFMIKIFFNKVAYTRYEYSNIIAMLGYFGFYITLYSLFSLLVSFYLSIKKVYIYIPILFGAVLQIILISFYHQSFMQIIFISIGIIFVLLLSHLLYYPYATRK